MKIAWRVLLSYFVIGAIAALILGQVFLEQVKPAVRQTTEDALADTAYTLADLAADDLAAGRIATGAFATHLRALQTREIHGNIWGHEKKSVAYRVSVTDAKGIVVFDSQGQSVGRDNSKWNDVARTLRGQYGARSSVEFASDPDSTVMWVAAPIRYEGRLIGVLSVGKPNRVVQPYIAASLDVILRWGLVLVGFALFVGVTMSWWLSRELRQLRDYAHAVTAGENVTSPKVSAEFGELGRALEQMRLELDGKQYVEEYVHTLTHELKSPLASIQASAEILEGDLTPEDRAKFVGHVQTQSNRMAEMVDRLLALASVEHRRSLEDPKPVDVRAVLKEAITASESTAVTTGLRFTMDSPASVVVTGDAFLLRQALVNLLDNAIGFSPAQGEIRCVISTSDESVSIVIEDEGPGIPDYAQEKVFERFYSLPRHAGGSRSSGIGLTFVQAIAALHGGSAQLENTDKGARATLTLAR